MSKPDLTIWLRMLFLLACVWLFTGFVRGILPEFFYVHGTPEQEYNQWQPLGSLTPLENGLTLALGIGLAIAVVAFHVRAFRRRSEKHET